MDPRVASQDGQDSGSLMSLVSLQTALPSNSMTLLDMPLDLLTNIFDLLPLPAKIILMQSCKNLRATFGAYCYSAVKATSTDDRRDCVKSLGYLLEGYRICLDCISLHDMRRRTSHIPPLWSHCPMVPGFPLDGNPPFLFRHAKNAMRGTRLEFYRHNNPLTLSAVFSSHDAVNISSDLLFTTQMRASRDQDGLHVQKTFDFRGRNERKRVTHEMVAAIKFHICPHLTCGKPMVDVPNNLEVHLGLYYENRHPIKKQRISKDMLLETNHCRSCKTKFVILRVEGAIQIRVDQDFGMCSNPDDPDWTSHIWTPDGEAQELARLA